MAGIGFELRKLLRNKSFFGMLRAYGFAGAISSGPWLLSIFSVLAIGVLGKDFGHSQQMVRFQVTVTYLMAVTLILTGGFQLSLSRFIADKLFEKKPHQVLPNLLGAMTLTSLCSGALATLLIATLFSEPLPCCLLIIASFVCLSNIWILVVVLSSLKAYREVLLAFALGCGVTVLGALLLRPFDLVGLLGGFFIGHALLLFILLGLVVRSYPSREFVAFQFLLPGRRYPSLMLTGFVYSLAIWCDKFIFWYNPDTSEAVMGPLRSSLIYDIPIFLAYLSIVPGMSIFLVRIETDFVERYVAFYQSVRTGDTLENLQYLKDRMVYAVRQGIYEILKVQGLTVIVLILSGKYVLDAAGISRGYLFLFFIDVVAAGLQVLMMAIFNVFYYLDQRRITLGLSVLFLVTNSALTLATQTLGPTCYGYGFALSALLTSMIGLGVLSAKFDRLEYETFMMQPL